MLFGRPLALFGVLFYLALFFLSFLSALVGSVSHTSKVDALFAVVTLSLLDSIFLLYISLAKIGTVCPVCAGVYVVNILLWVALWRAMPDQGVFQRIFTGLFLLVSSPVRFFALFFKQVPFGVRMFAAGCIVVPLLSLFITEVGFAYMLKHRRSEIYEKALDLPWPKTYAMPDTIQVGKGPFGDYYNGSPDAPIKIVEMFDYECGHCRHFYAEIKELLKEYEGKYLLVYKNYPLDNDCNESIKFEAHQHACYAAHIARCAGEQGRFHEVSDYILTADLFGSDMPDDQARAGIDKAIQLYGLDEAELRGCMESGRQLEHIQEDIKLGNALGLTGTPSVWVNGRKVPDVGMPVMRRIFDDILEQ
jgi:protein-disulfide isomerase